MARLRFVLNTGVYGIFENIDQTCGNHFRIDFKSTQNTMKFFLKPDIMLGSLGLHKIGHSVPERLHINHLDVQVPSLE
jgi:hypothetical protein